jgi:hypothetical protein
MSVITKAAIVVLSDPRGGEEALGRLFNALATALEHRQAGDEVVLVFSGTGTRWLAELSRPDHPARGLWTQVEELVLGASCGCADVFGATEGVAMAGHELLKEFALPGTRGVASLRRLTRDGYAVVTF